MPSRTRSNLVAVLALAALAACTGATQPPPALSQASGEAAATVATFEGRYDPATGKLTFQTTPTADATSRLGRSAFEPFVDGAPGGPVNTFELKNGAAIGTGNACGGAASWGGYVTLTHFFSGVTFSSVAVELTSLIPSGREACNSATATDGMSAAYGLWDYGSGLTPMVAGVPVTLPWYFKQTDAGAFTFKGRIMATMAPLAAPTNPAGSFEWAPWMFADPPHSFQDDPVHTVSHVIWDGVAQQFVDTKGVATFTRIGAAVPSTTVGIAYPTQAYVGPRLTLDGWRYEASPATLALDTSGDFTVCAKFKPGVNPGDLERKVLVAIGNPIGQTNSTYAPADLGWALTQQHGGPPTGGPQYGFFYRTGDALDTSATDAFVDPGPNPQNSAFDYVCGGRATLDCVYSGQPGAGPCIRVMAHGRDVHFDTKVNGTYVDHIADPAALPFVIGAAAGGLWPALDEGVYEVIIDSRPASLATMREIVDAAEGRRTYNGAAYLGNDVDALPVPGVDLVTYGFPLGSTAPVTSDATGLMTSGTLLRFASVLGTSPGAYCIGAEVTSTDWVNALGGIVGDENGILRLFIPATDHVLSASNGGRPAWANGVNIQAFAANSRHVFKVCSTTGGAVELWVDGSLADSRTTASTLFDLTSAANQLYVGQARNQANALAPLTGARIGRVFACPTAVASNCN